VSLAPSPFRRLSGPPVFGKMKVSAFQEVVLLLGVGTLYHCTAQVLRQTRETKFLEPQQSWFRLCFATPAVSVMSCREYCGCGRNFSLLFPTDTCLQRDAVEHRRPHVCAFCEADQVAPRHFHDCWDDFGNVAFAKSFENALFVSRCKQEQPREGTRVHMQRLGLGSHHGNLNKNASSCKLENEPSDSGGVRGLVGVWPIAWNVLCSLLSNFKGAEHVPQK